MCEVRPKGTIEDMTQVGTDLLKSVHALDTYVQELYKEAVENAAILPVMKSPLVCFWGPYNKWVEE